MEPQSWEEIRERKNKWMHFGRDDAAYKEVEYLEEMGLLNLAKEKWRILELGFGYSRFLKSLVEIKGIPEEYVGVEKNRHWVEEARKYFFQRSYNFKFIQGDIQDQRLYEGIKEADFIAAFEVFQFLEPDFRNVLRNLRKVVAKEGGYLCFTILERPFRQRKTRKEKRFFERSYDPKEVEAILEENNWEIREKWQIHYGRGQHTRAFYLCTYGIPKGVREKDLEELKEEIGIFLDSMQRVTGGHKRRVNMAKEFHSRGWNVSILVSRYGMCRQWKGLEMPILQEKAKAPLEKKYLFMGDSRWDWDLFKKAKGQKIWMFQGMRMNPPEDLRTLWKSSSVTLLTFSTYFQDLVRKKIHRESVLAPGAVDVNFYRPPETEAREKTIVFSSWHFGLPTLERRKVMDFMKENGWIPEKLSGTELEIRDQYQKAGMVISLRGDLEGLVYRDWNNPIAEGMATKTPAILVKAGGSQDIAIHKKTAYVIPVKNEVGTSLQVSPDEIIEGLRWMMENEEERRKMAERAWKHIQGFSYKKMIDIIEKEILEK